VPAPGDSAEVQEKHRVNVAKHWAKLERAGGGDSAELATHRETVTNCDCPCAEAGQALLRLMAGHKLSRFNETVAQERDELRVKLADALNGGYCPQCGDAGLTAAGAEALEKLTEPLRAKLAEAENGGAEWRKTLTMTEQRAEAAEARVTARRAVLLKAVEMLCADEPNMKMQTADLLRAELNKE